MQSFRYILFIFSILYGLILSIRNYFYDKGWLKTISFPNQFIICVGNLSVGGTGKTPHVEYLNSLLSNRKKAILSRGYGRKTKGVLIADENSTSSQIGDEPAQYVSKLYPSTKICVAESRVEGAKRLINKFSSIDTIILDDAFQHRAIGRNLNLMLTDYNELFYNDYMLPTGNLREFRSGAKRADAVVITKCYDELSVNQTEKIELNISQYTEAKIFYSKVKYGELVFINGEQNDNVKVTLLTGIANYCQILNYVKDKYDFQYHKNYADHYDYQQSDIDSLIYENDDILIITTEKDAVKLKQLDLKNLNIAYLPIQVEFFGKEFDNFVLSKI